MTVNGEADCDYVVVGSGAGGGTVAARLAEAGWHVVLLEAGGDARHAGAPGLPEAYDVPAFHALASEHRQCAGISSSAITPTTNNSAVTQKRTSAVFFIHEQVLSVVARRITPWSMWCRPTRIGTISQS